MTPDERAALERAKAASVGQLLFRAARLFNERAMSLARERLSLPGLRPAHAAVFPHIDLAVGTRLTDSATAMGVSKQAVAVLVDELVEMGALEKRPDPEDGRAKRIAFPLREPHPILDGLAVLGSLEGEVNDAIGDRRFRALQRALVDIVALFESSDARP